MNWIAVADNLPELGAHVLASDGKWVGEAVWCRDSMKGWDARYWWVYSEKFKNIDVTHWMPLPEPPK